MFKQLQKLGKAFMLPISILPAAGLLLGIGGALSNPNTVAAYPILDVPVLQRIFTIMSAAGNVVFANIALIMCIGLAVGLATADKGTAGLAAAVAFLVMNATIAAMIDLFHPEGVESIDTGVIGALIIGLLTTYLHNRYRHIKLPPFLGFFGGSRFIPILSAFTAIFVGAAFFLLWPPFQQVLVGAGEALAKLGPVGTGVYGALLRVTGAIGLHHTIYPLFWYTELGGVEIVNGVRQAGAQNIFFAQLADPNHTGLFTEGIRFYAGRFAVMMFGLPAAALAMYQSVPKERRSKVVGLYASAALTSFLTGITEPLEFMFLFVAPWLYGIHAVLDGVSYFLADLFAVRVGNTFSSGLIDFFLFGILQGNDKTNWIRVIPIGLALAVAYYALFRYLVPRFQVAIPGREPEGDEEGESVSSGGDDDLNQTAGLVLEALGGEENVEDVDACITRLRVAVKDPGKVDKAAIQRLGATAVLEVQGGIQAIFGAKADLLKGKINEMLGRHG